MSTISVINSRDCTGCLRNTGFNFMDSFSLRKIIDKHMRYLIGGYIAQGILAQDDLKPFQDNNFTMRQFPFLLVNEWQQSPFEKVDGVIGLSRDYVTAEGDNSGSQFLNTLYDAGIENKIFHINFLPKDSKYSSSIIGFGGYN